jgi:hypothetical protein
MGFDVGAGMGGALGGALGMATLNPALGIAGLVGGGLGGGMLGQSMASSAIGPYETEEDKFERMLAARESAQLKLKNKEKEAMSLYSFGAKRAVAPQTMNMNANGAPQAGIIGDHFNEQIGLVDKLVGQGKAKYPYNANAPFNPVQAAGVRNNPAAPPLKASVKAPAPALGKAGSVLAFGAKLANYVDLHDSPSSDELISRAKDVKNEAERTGRPVVKDYAKKQLPPHEVFQNALRRAEASGESPSPELFSRMQKEHDSAQKKAQSACSPCAMPNGPAKKPYTSASPAVTDASQKSVEIGKPPVAKTEHSAAKAKLPEEGVKSARTKQAQPAIQAMTKKVGPQTAKPVNKNSPFPAKMPSSATPGVPVNIPAAVRQQGSAQGPNFYNNVESVMKANPFSSLNNINTPYQSQYPQSAPPVKAGSALSFGAKVAAGIYTPTRLQGADDSYDSGVAEERANLFLGESAPSQTNVLAGRKLMDDQRIKSRNLNALRQDVASYKKPTALSVTGDALKNWGRNIYNAGDATAKRIWRTGEDIAAYGGPRNALDTAVDGYMTGFNALTSAPGNALASAQKLWNEGGNDGGRGYQGPPGSTPQVSGKVGPKPDAAGAGAGTGAAGGGMMDYLTNPYVVGGGLGALGLGGLMYHLNSRPKKKKRDEEEV